MTEKANQKNGRQEERKPWRIQVKHVNVNTTVTETYNGRMNTTLILIVMNTTYVKVHYRSTGVNTERHGITNRDTQMYIFCYIK